MKNELYVIGVDLGGTTVRVCAFKGSNPVFIDILKEPSSITDTPQLVLDHIDQMIQRLMDNLQIQFEEVESIGISLPDAIDPENGAIYAPSTLLSWKGLPIRSYFVNKYPVPVYIENDANMAALGEYRFGTGQGSRDMVYLTLSTGVGAGIIVDGQLYRGSHGIAGEVGQFIIDPNGPMCPHCGRNGCTDMLGSGTGVAILAKQFLGRGEKIGNFTKETKDDITALDVVAAARGGDTIAQEIIKSTALVVAQVIHTIIFTLNPDTIVIGGGFSAAYDLLYPVIDTYLAENLPVFIKEGIKIVKNDLGGDAGLLGALAIRNKRKSYTLKAVIFDLDGVTIFSEDAHKEAFGYVISKHFGQELTAEDYKFYFMGKTDAQGFQDYLTAEGHMEYNLDLLLEDVEKEFFQIYATKVKGNENILHLMQQLYERKIPLAIASSSTRKDVNKAIETFHLEKFITGTISADDITHWKPSAEPYIIAASKLNVLPDECLVIEDSPAGIKSAKDAGAVCLALTTTHASTQLVGADSVKNTVALEDILMLMRQKDIV